MLIFSKCNLFFKKSLQSTLTSKVSIRWYNTTIGHSLELSTAEEEAVDLPFAAIKEDKNMLILRGNASAKMMDLDSFYYMQAINCYSRAAEFEEMSIKERISLYGKCAHISGLNRDIKNQQEFVLFIDKLASMLDTKLPKDFSSIPDKQENNNAIFHDELSSIFKVIANSHEELAKCYRECVHRPLIVPMLRPTG